MPLIRNIQRSFGSGNVADETDAIEFGEVTELAIVDESGTALFIPDASIVEAHRKEIEITSNPVEFGAEISDHAIILPRRFTLQGRITNTPLRNNADDFSSEYPSASRVSGAWEFLIDIANLREPVFVRTNLGTYDNMLIKTLSADQDWRTSQVLDFTAEFIEIFVADAPESEVTQISVTLKSGGTSDQASPTSSRGVIPAKSRLFGKIDPSQLIIKGAQ